MYELADIGSRTPDWPALIADYRLDPSGGAGAEIVEALLPRLRRLANGYESLPGTIDHEDVLQQLVLEVLVGAGSMRLPSDPHWVPRRLLLRARTYVARWLARETRQLGISLDAIEDRLVTGASTGTRRRRVQASAHPRSEFNPPRNHARPTQKPRSSATFTPTKLWIKKVGPNQGRRTR